MLFWFGVSGVGDTPGAGGARCPGWGALLRSLIGDCRPRQLPLESQLFSLCAPIESTDGPGKPYRSGRFIRVVSKRSFANEV